MRIILLLNFLFAIFQLSAQTVSVSKALFKQGDDMSWAKPEMDDASWRQKDLSPDERAMIIFPHGCRYLKIVK